MGPYLWEPKGSRRLKGLMLDGWLGRMAWVRIVACMAPLRGLGVWVLVVHGVIGWAVLPRRVLVLFLIRIVGGIP